MTKLTFLGTCAANFSKKLKDEFKNSFDKDARRASCMLIDESVLIDCGMYCMESLQIIGADLSKITDIFITHLHADHFNAEHIAKIAAAKKTPLNLWCRRDAEIPFIANTNVINMNQFDSYDLKNGFKVEAVDANHDESSFPQHYIFTIDGKKFMYACDGAWFLTRSYNHLKNAELSLLVIDATCGDYLGDYRIAEHNSIPMIRMMLPSLKKVGIINENTRIFLSHIAPSLHLPHDETVKLVAKDNLNVAYDGLVLYL